MLVREENHKQLLFVIIAVAYLFSMAVRMYWPLHFLDEISMYNHHQLMINTNDGYYFASGAKDILLNIIPEDRVRYSAFQNTLSQITAWITVYSPFSLNQIILYLSAFISSLVVIPIILTGRLMGHTFLGFFAALVGSIAWSYYNRTMTGYYDTDMFSIFLQFSIFYSFLYIAYKKNIYGVMASIILILVYPYLYPQGISITYAMFSMLLIYVTLEYFEVIVTKETIAFSEKTITVHHVVILLSISLMLLVPIELRVILIGIAFIVLQQVRNQKYLLYGSIIAFLAFLYFGNMFNSIWVHLSLYLSRGTEEIKGLHFYQVIQTVKEAGAIPFKVIANRISGSMLGFLLSIIGFVFLVIRHKPFIIALPLIGVGLFSYVGGLRFTVYAVPIAALSVIYFFWFISHYFFRDIRLKYMTIAFGTIAILYPNIQHVISYTVPTVMNKTEVEDLEKLNQISSRKDYIISWWDYAFPIWYYADTSTLIDGGKHQNDNFIISKIMQTTSSSLAVNLSRLSVETYVDSNYSIITNTLFKNVEAKQLNPNLFLSELEDNNYMLPKKTRDVYLYLPYRMLNIFPTVALFGNLDLTTGKAERNIVFYPTFAVANKNGMLTFKNGIIFDANNGVISFGRDNKDVKSFIITQLTKEGKTKIKSQVYHSDGKYIVVFMQSYGQFVVMDSEIFNSMYVQMFILGKYDKNLFELVVSSPYSKIYKLKK